LKRVTKEYNSQSTLQSEGKIGRLLLLFFL